MDVLAEHVVGVAQLPAALVESIASILVRAARSLHHTVERQKLG